jgi:hypothetical protein
LTIRRSRLIAAAAFATVLASCGGTPPSPDLTDPKAIVTAALTSSKAAKSVHFDMTVDGTATVALPIGGGAPTTLDLTGTTAAADVDLGKPAAKSTFSLVAGLTIKGEAIAIDRKAYVKTTLTGPLYQETPPGSLPIPTDMSSVFDNLGGLLLAPGVTLVKGGDVACGSASCYTVTTDLTAEQLAAIRAAGGSLPVDLEGATMKLTARVEKAVPNHLAGITAVLSTPKNTSLNVEVTASKWDAPVSIAAPPAEQVKPLS